MHPILAAENPEMTFGELSRHVGSQWHAISAEDKQLYLDLAEEDKERYAAEMAVWNARTVSESSSSTEDEDSDDGGRRRGKRKAKKKNGGVSQAKSAYNYYVKTMRPAFVLAHPEMGFGELSRQMGLQWQAISTKDKQPYVDLAEEDKERYLAEAAVWKASQPAASESDSSLSSSTEDENSDDGERQRKKRKRKKKKKKNGGVSQAKSAYNYYVKTMRPTFVLAHPEMGFGELSRQMGSTWQALSAEDKDKQHCHALAEEDKERFAAELAEWKASAPPESSSEDEDSSSLSSSCEDEDEERSVNDLKSLCRELGLATRGSKALLETRLSAPDDYRVWCGSVVLTSDDFVHALRLVPCLYMRLGHPSAENMFQWKMFLEFTGDDRKIYNICRDLGSAENGPNPAAFPEQVADYELL